MNIEIRGLTELVHRLDRIQVNAILKPPMNRSVIKIETEMKRYPPPPPTSTYRRTRVLGNSWNHRVDSDRAGVRGTVGTNIRYAPWVQSRRFQARIHQGRWKPAEQVLEELQSEIIDDFNGAVSGALRG